MIWWQAVILGTFAIIGAWTVASATVAVIWMLLRRWWTLRDSKPPAGSRADSPDRAETASQRSSLPGPAPSPPVSPPPPAGTATTAHVNRFTADLGCGCHITHYTAIPGHHTMDSERCALHQCTWCGWRIGERDGDAVYVYEWCPAHETAATP